MEVVPEEAERGARGERGQHPGGVPVERERDHREGGRRDRAHPRGQPVRAVGEVHDVHHRHHPHQREHRAPVAELERLHERQRQVGDLHSRGHRDRRRPELADQLQQRRQPALARVVERADQGDGHRSGQDPARLAVVRQEQRPRHHHGREDRQPAQTGHVVVVEVSVPRLVEHPEPAGEPGGGGSGHEGDDCRDEERPEGIELVHSARSLLADRHGPVLARVARPGSAPPWGPAG